jgi:autotransporter family porin
MFHLFPIKGRFAPASDFWRVDGQFTGTTDEILQWAACKWGMNTDIVRAMAWQESSWRQGAVGSKGTYGLLQIKRVAHPAGFPAAQRSTAFNADYALAWWRACVDGDIPWLSAAARGDVWGCVASYASGRWDDPYGQSYALAVRRHVSAKPWLR